VQSTFAESATDSKTLWLALLLAVAGGIALNRMPCVFPVLSIKALSQVQQAHGSRSSARRHGLSYMVGSLVRFALLALVLIAFKAAGSQIGWGFQFQSPVFMGAAVAFALAAPAWQLLLVFLGLGLDLAAPILLLSWWPALQRWLPRPGVWMETLKQALAFPMYGAAIWLVWVIAQQSGAQGVLQVLSSLGLLALAA
jgi:thiol:disulfide interchange protein DsbD